MSKSTQSTTVVSPPAAKGLTEEQYQIYLAAVNEVERIRSFSDDEKYDLIQQITSSTFIDLLCDWAFKHIFGHNKEHLMMLLNDFLPERIAAVEEIHMTPNEADPWRGGDKHVIMDVTCRLEDGRSIIVEMQKSKNSEFRNRMLFYGASMISHQLKRSDSYTKITPVYVICFMNFRLRHSTDQLVYRYQMCEQDTGEHYGNQMNIYFCELPRFLGKPRKDLTPIEEWFEILKNMTTFVTKPEDINSRFNSLFEACRQNDLNDKNRLQYFRAMIDEQEKRGIAEANWEDGFDEGLERGRMDEREATARRMLEDHVPAETIAKYSGLTEEQIKAL